LVIFRKGRERCVGWGNRLCQEARAHGVSGQEYFFAGILGGPHVGHAHVAFFSDHESGPGLRSDGTVPGGVAEESAGNTSERAGRGVHGVD